MAVSCISIDARCDVRLFGLCLPNDLLHDLRHKGWTYLKNYKGNRYLPPHPVRLFLEVLHGRNHHGVYVQA